MNKCEQEYLDNLIKNLSLNDLDQLRKLAKKIIDNKQDLNDEEIKEWAEKLANDVCKY